jgi:agmatine deiminase
MTHGTRALAVGRRPEPEALAALFRASTGEAPPPASRIYRNDTAQPVTAIPEYAPMGGLLLSYPGVDQASPTGTRHGASGARTFGVPDELIVRAQQNDTGTPVQVFVFCADQARKPEIDVMLNACAERLGLRYDPDGLHLIPWDTDTFWTRDYGPWWTRTVTGERYAIAKHFYTSLGGGLVGVVEGADPSDPRLGKGIFRPHDDYGAVAFSDFLNAPIFAWNQARWPGGKALSQLPVHDWVFTGLLDVGGNYMVTGRNKIASSYLVATQNQLPEARPVDGGQPPAGVVERRLSYILAQLNRFMGITEYHVLTDPTGTYIGHIDCWGKFLADDKVMIARSMNPTVDAAFDRIAEAFQADGFAVSRVLLPDLYVPGGFQPATTAAYTNSLILNGHVYVPLAGGGRAGHDAAALAAYRNAMPGYEVIGILPKPEHPWLGTDALHCRTNVVPRAVIDAWQRARDGSQLP